MLLTAGLLSFSSPKSNTGDRTLNCTSHSAEEEKGDLIFVEGKFSF